MTVAVPKAEGPELAMDSSQPNAVPEPAIVQANTSTLLRTGGDDSKAPKLYLEVGTFKDETWANNAVDKLTQLGFHAVLIQKNLLWTQSYHVEVGPYTNQKDIAEARRKPRFARLQGTSGKLSLPPQSNKGTPPSILFRVEADD